MRFEYIKNICETKIWRNSLKTKDFATSKTVGTLSVIERMNAMKITKENTTEVGRRGNQGF